MLAAADYHELPIPLRYDLHRGDEDAVPRWWNAAVLPRHWCCSGSRHVFHQLKHRSHELTEVCRTGLPLRRHSCKCRNPGVAALKFVPQRHAIARADHLRVTLVVSPPLFPDPKLTHFQSAAAFRMILTPVDTLKTTLQVQGARGTALLRQRIKSNGVGSLWWGAFATAAATFVGHYPWFATVCFASSLLCPVVGLTVTVQLPHRSDPGAATTPAHRMAASSGFHRGLCFDCL